MKKETIYLAGGCFWGTEKYMQGVDGVLETRVGYAGVVFVRPFAVPR